MYGSSGWIIDRTFTLTVYFANKSLKQKKARRNYRNPIYLAKEYKRTIDSGQAKNQSDLANQLGISRVYVNHFINLLKFDIAVIQTIEQLGDPMPKRYVSERKLRSIVKMPIKEQRPMIQSILSQ